MPFKPFILSVFLLSALLPAGLQAQDKKLNLLEIYQQALARDPVLASALSSNKAAQEIIEQGKALYRPTVNFNAGVVATKSNIEFNNVSSNFPRVAGRASYEGYNYGLEARQPIYRQQNLVQMDQAYTQVSIADKQYHLSQQNLILRTTQAYFNVLIAQDKIELIKAQKTAILSQLEQAKITFEVGTATITDVNEAQARYDLIVAQEIAAVNEFEIAQHEIEQITGEVPPALATVKADLQANALNQSMQNLLDVALQNNLNVAIQQDTLKLAEQDVAFNKAAHMPTLDAVANYSDNYNNGGLNGFGSELNSASIGLQLQIPLYQGGAISSRVRQALLNQQKAKDDLEIVRRQTDLETQRAYLNLSSSIAQIKALEQALISSQSQLDSTKLGYEVGVRISVDVLNAQQQLFSAKRDLLQARYNYLVNIIRLKSATGIVAEVDLQDINQQLVLAPQ
ncbi:MAG: TolC family outer membrane protein [Pseudomonadota bacterium]